MPGDQQRPPRPKHDASYKTLFANPRTVADTLRVAEADLARHLDFATLERIPASFVTKHLDQRHADMLWRIRTTDGHPVYILVLLEFQSTVESAMALRMADYVVTIWRGLGRKDLGPGGAYPFVLPVVVYNGRRPWNAATDIGQLIGDPPEWALGFWPSLRYLLVQIQSQDHDSLPRNNALAMISAFERAPSADALLELTARLDEWLKTDEDRELAKAVLAWVFHVLSRRFGPEGRELTRNLIDKEEDMTTLIERAKKWGEERDQLWLQKGLEQGLEKGREEGRQRGREEGLEAGLERERRLMHRQVGRRFGAVTADRILPVLEGISDPEGIALVADAVIECRTAEEFIERVGDG